MHRRDRSERFAFATLFSRMLGSALNVRSDFIEAMLNAYKDELTQASYTPQYAKKQRQQAKAVASRKTKKKLDDEALLQKLDRLTVPDEKSPAAKAGARRK